MCLTISELKGNRLKKDLDLDKAFFRWHNKNKTWGNFGINLITKEGLENCEITGNYKKPNGEIYGLRFGVLYQCGYNLPKVNYSEMIKLLKKAIGKESLEHKETEQRNNLIIEKMKKDRKSESG